MSIAIVQSVNGTGTTVTLNNVVAGNTLILIANYFRTASTGSAPTAPTDSNGTVSTASAGTPSNWNAGSARDMGTSIWYVENANAGTHTLTPQSNSGMDSTLLEVSGLLTSGVFDVAADAKTNNFAGTSQVTGTTAATSQAAELVLIALALGAEVGNVDVGFTDPVSGFTTRAKRVNDLSGIAWFIAYKEVAATGTQSATFNWTDTEANQGAHGAVATFKAAAAATLMGRACL